MKSNRAIVFFGWGTKHFNLVARCVSESRLPDYPVVRVLKSQTLSTGRLLFQNSRSN